MSDILDTFLTARGVISEQLAEWNGSDCEVKCNRRVVTSGPYHITIQSAIQSPIFQATLAFGHNKGRSDWSLSSNMQGFECLNPLNLPRAEDSITHRDY